MNSMQARLGGGLQPGKHLCSHHLHSSTSFNRRLSLAKQNLKQHDMGITTSYVHTSCSRKHTACVHNSAVPNAVSEPSTSEQGSSDSAFDTLENEQQDKHVSMYVRPPEIVSTPASITDSGTLRPDPEWYPAWMRYRRREENYVFWKDKFTRCSMDVPGG